MTTIHMSDDGVFVEQPPWLVEVNLKIYVDDEGYPLTAEEAVAVARDRALRVPGAQLYSHSNPRYLYRTTKPVATCSETEE